MVYEVKLQLKPVLINGMALTEGRLEVEEIH